MRGVAAFFAAFSAVLSACAAVDFAGLGALDLVLPLDARRNAAVSPSSLEADDRVFAACAADSNFMAFSNAQHQAWADGFAALSRTLEQTDDAGKTVFLQARGFCLPDPGLVDSAVRARLFSTYDLALCRSCPAIDAETWFRARMDGTMEDFSLGRVGDGPHYRSLVSAEFLWQDPVPVQLKGTRTFTAVDGRRKRLRFFQIEQPVEMLESRVWSILVLRIAGGIEFVTVSPRTGVDLAAVRRALPWSFLYEKLALLASRVDPNAWQGVARVTTPMFDIRSRYDLAQIGKITGRMPCGIARAPLASAETWVAVRQMGAPASRDPARPPSDLDEDDDEIGPRTRDVELARPFLFLFRHSATRSVLIAGQFTGIE